MRDQDTHAVPTPPRFGWLRWLDRLGPLVGLLVLWGLFAALRPQTFPTWPNNEVILLQTAVVATAAVGMTVIIIAGGIDLSVASVIAVVCVCIALMLNAGVPPLVAALGAVALGAACGAATGALVSFCGIGSFIVTLGAMGAYRGLAKGLAGEQMITVPHQGWLGHLLRPLRAGEHWMLLPPGVWIMAVVALLGAGFLRYTRLGHHVFAVGSNEQTARLCGVRVRLVKLAVFSLGGAMAGIAGVLQFARDNVGNPTTAPAYELSVIAAVVIGGGSLAGGQGSIFGSIVGALVMSTIANGCNKVDMPTWVQEIITGLIIIAAVGLDRLRHRYDW